MNVHEYQAKALLERHGIEVPRGDVADTPEAARRIAAQLHGKVVIKAQIHAGGRGRGTFRDASTGESVLRPDTDQPLGGVVVVDGPKAARDVAARMLGNFLITKQTGPEGRVVRRVLIAEALEIAREFYLALLVDRALRAPTFIASAEGGVDIEEVAVERPEAILRIGVDPRVGFSPWIGRRIAFGLGLSGEQASAAGKLAAGLHRVLIDTDASLVEVNPLVATKDGRILALDAKMTFDDNALYRHPDVGELRDATEEDPLEVEASKSGLNYVKLDGTVGCMVNGAGLAMATMDIIELHGGRPANFLDVGGGATAEMVTSAFGILTADPNVKAVLINIFGGIMRCDVVAEGVVEAAHRVGSRVPVVVRLEGTNVDRGREILRHSGMRFELAEDMDDAARKVVAAARRA